jgi:hypothetical protein
MTVQIWQTFKLVSPSVLFEEGRTFICSLYIAEDFLVANTCRWWLYCFRDLCGNLTERRGFFFIKETVLQENNIFNVFTIQSVLSACVWMIFRIERLSSTLFTIRRLPLAVQCLSQLYCFPLVPISCYCLFKQYKFFRQRRLSEGCSVRPLVLS